MRALVQRVSEATVSVGSEQVGKIGKGVLIFLGVKKGDTIREVRFLVDKISNLRIFCDENGKFDFSLLDVCGEVLVVSQFTLYGDCQKGRRPSFIDAADPVEAEQRYFEFISEWEKTGLRVATGRFQAMMDVRLTNDGPVTIMLEK